MNSPGLDAFIELAQSRRATRHFKPEPLPDGLLDRLLDAARWAPSGYNLQPTRFVVVTDPALRGALRRPCFDQAQVAQAPAVVVFCGDRQVVRRHLDAMIAAERAHGTVDDRYEALMRKYIGLAFGTGPMGLGWLGRAVAPLLRPIMRVPSIPAVHRNYWLGKQAALSAMTFMLAARAAGLDTCPMEGFDPVRVRKVLGLPRHWVPMIVVPVGYAASPSPRRTRLPIGRLAQYNRASA